MKKSQKFNLKKNEYIFQAHFIIRLSVRIIAPFYRQKQYENLCKNSIFRTIFFAKMGYFTGFFGKKQSENFHENNFFCGNAKF